MKLLKLIVCLLCFYSVSANSQPDLFIGIWSGEVIKQNNSKIQAKLFIKQNKAKEYEGVFLNATTLCIYKFTQQDLASKNTVVFNLTDRIYFKHSDCESERKMKKGTLTVEIVTDREYDNFQANVKYENTKHPQLNLLGLLETPANESVQDKNIKYAAWKMFNERFPFHIHQKAKGLRDYILGNKKEGLALERKQAKNSLARNVYRAQQTQSSLPYNSYKLVKKSDVMSLYIADNSQCGEDWTLDLGHMGLNAVFDVPRKFEFTEGFIKQHLSMNTLLALHKEICVEKSKALGSDRGTIFVNVFVKGIYMSAIRKKYKKNDAYLKVAEEIQPPPRAHRLLQVRVAVNPFNRKYEFKIKPTETGAQRRFIELLDPTYKNEIPSSVSTIDKHIAFNKMVATQLDSGWSATLIRISEREKTLSEAMKRLAKYKIKFKSKLVAAYVDGNRSLWEDIYASGYHFDPSNKRDTESISAEYKSLYKVYILVNSKKCKSDMLQPSRRRNFINVTYANGHREVTGDTNYSYYISDGMYQLAKSVGLQFAYGRLELYQSSSLEIGDNFFYSTKEKDIQHDIVSLIDVNGCASEPLSKFERSMLLTRAKWPN
jgi:hypothetical protein